FQPISDFLKLFNKYFWVPKKGNLPIFIFTPILCVFVGLIKLIGFLSLIKRMGKNFLLFFTGILSFSCTNNFIRANRTPFDLTEGESELVSGFNTEYLGGLLSFFFITEYAFIIFLSFLTTIFFLGERRFWLKQILIISFFIFTRRAFPRIRFD
ncbi:NADH dehydrogenase subunit 1-like protein, partial [Leptotrombidium deliense]